MSGPHPATINVPKIAQDGTEDYEAELAVILSKTGRDIPEEKALEYVLGYTASNDVSARTQQHNTSQWSFAKGEDFHSFIRPWESLLTFCNAGLDGAAPVGPVLVSPAAIPNPHTLDIKAIYNGSTVQDTNTR